MINQDDKVNAITAAIAAANARGDERHAAVAASREDGSATPNWLACDDLQAVLDELEAGEDWDVVGDEDEIADVLGDARDVMGVMLTPWPRGPCWSAYTAARTAHRATYAPSTSSCGATAARTRPTSSA